MRLLPRLLLSVSVPLVIVMVAVGLVFASMSRVASALSELRLGELSSMQNEAALHRAGWDLDVALRHGAERCVRDPRAAAHVSSRIGAATAELEARLASSPNAHPQLVLVAQDYLLLARQLEQQPGCELTASSTFQGRRSALDEEMTNVWVDRMGGLHNAVVAREAQMNELMTATLFGGFALMSFALVVALVVSFALTRSVTVPLAALTSAARRLGSGELEAPVPTVGGATELVEFGRELESMRERLAELDSLKQGFIASCSHELRTPLSKMREALALLTDGAAGELNARQRQVVEIARRACERQIRTVTSILDLSRLRAGTPVRFRPDASVDAVVRAAVEQERPEAEARQVGLRIDWVDAKGAHGDLDDALLEHALANLVRNAVSVSRPGQEVVVEGRVRREGEAVTWVDLDVVDEGPGIPEGMERAIFEPFVTHAPSISPKRVGVGLGLALAREVATVHGGGLELIPKERGTTFRLSIPLGRASETSAEEPAR